MIINRYLNFDKINKYSINSKIKIALKFSIFVTVKNNVILGFKTNNFSTNGFSLIRKVLLLVESCDDSNIDLSEETMFDTFNMGIGFCLIVPKNKVNSTLEICMKNDFEAWNIGQVVESQNNSKHIGIFGIPS